MNELFFLEWMYFKRECATFFFLAAACYFHMTLLSILLKIHFSFIKAKESNKSQERPEPGTAIENTQESLKKGKPKR